MPKTIVVLFATAAMDAFLAAALHGIARVGIGMADVLVVQAGEVTPGARDMIVASGASAMPLSDLSSATPRPSPDVYSDYGTRSFNLLMRYRIEALRHLMEHYPRILVSDLDVAWFRNPLPYLDARLDVFPWVSQTEGLESFPCFCAGFFAFRDCFFSRHLLDAIADHIGRDGGAQGDQEHLNAILAGEPELVRNIFPLPELLFPNGLQSRAVMNRRDDQPAGVLQRPDPFIYHANFTIGLADKAELMQAVGALGSHAVPPR